MHDDFLFSGTTKLSIVIPAFNEEHRLPELFRALRGLNGEPEDFEIIIVDDGSTDKTAEIAEDFLRDFNCKGAVISLPKNLGKGNALREGVLLTDSPFLLTVDADMATDLSDLDHALNLLSDHHIVIGSRNLPNSEIVGMSLRRRLLTKSFNQIFRLVTNIGLSDTRCGFKLYRTPIAKCLFAASSVNGFAQDAELIYLAEANSLSITEIAVRWTAIPGSKVKVISDSLHSLKELALRKRRSSSLAIFDSVIVDNISRTEAERIVSLNIFPRGAFSLWSYSGLRVFFPVRLNVNSEEIISQVTSIASQAAVNMSNYSAIKLLELIEGDSK